MKIKHLFLIALLVIGSHEASAGVTTYDNVFATNDVYSSDFPARLNANFQKSLTGGINAVTAANITDDSLLEADMADEINPRVRTYEGAACEFVYTGLLPVTGASLTQNTSAGTAYPRGYRINKASSTARTYTASRWTFVDIDINGDFQYSEVAIGGATPSIASNSIRLARVSTDGTQVLTVQDLRTTSCTNGPFSIISDASGEADLGDLLTNGAGGFHQGLKITTVDSNNVAINVGSARINGEYRSLSSNLSVPRNVTANGATSISGIDTGAAAANTNYHIYAVADEASVTNLTGVLSTSATTPTGMTNYRRIGEASTDNSATFASADAVTLSYSGLIRQIKRVRYTNTLSGTGTIPQDDSPPLLTEGDEYMRIRITPTSATSKLLITVNSFWTAGTGAFTAAICKVGVGTCLSATTEVPNTTAPISFSHVMDSDSTTEQTFTVRAGATGGTSYFNGNSGGRFYGGAAASTITIVEYD